MQNQNLSPSLKQFLAHFNGQILIPFIAASAAIGISAQTARNKLTEGTFPVRTIMLGYRRFVHIEDLAEFVEALRAESFKPKRGRPTKASKFHAAGGGGA